MKYQLNKAVVIGAGTMGASIAAHLANAGVRVRLLDIVPDKLTPEDEKKGLTLDDPVFRNRIAREGLANAIQSRPASFFTREHSRLVDVGNIEDDLDAIRDADWVIEAIIENLNIKQNLMERLENERGERTIISTNTSGIPIAAISEGRSQNFREHFLGTHFFNPPRYLKLLEVIPGEDTLPEVMDFIKKVGTFRLGKGVVLCKDTPNFIANRLGSVGGAFTVEYVLENGYSVKEVDSITGPPIGRPKTATFRLLDLVGIDVWNHITNNLAEAIPHDEHAQRYLNSKPLEELISPMVEKGLLGNKTKKGFYKQVKKNGDKEFWELNLESLEYEPPSKPRFDSVGRARKQETFSEKLDVMLSSEDRAGDLVRAIIFGGLSYASQVIPEIADTPKPIDDAMRWGFNHEAGPFEIWDMLGVAETSERMREVGFEPADWVDEMLEKGCQSFYKEANGSQLVYYPGEGEYQRVESDPHRVTLVALKKDKMVIDSNPSASLIDMGDGVVCVEFHTKMNILDMDTGKMIDEALNRVETDFEGLVIGNEAENFSAGANLFLLVMNAQAEQWEEIDRMVKGLQDLHMRIRYFQKPVVVAPAGLSLGGGAELTMHASRVVAHAELYTGLVELGTGVIPAGGGTKEMLRRVLNPPMRTQNADYLPFLQRLLEQIGQAKVATSAEEAKQFGMLTDCDRVVMNRAYLLAEAKREVLEMEKDGYHAPIPENIYAAGRDALAAMRVAIHMYKEGKQITEYEAHLAQKLAYVMAGGELSQPSWVSEQYILDLEREAFLSLCGEEKTQQRMWNLLNTGKPLRN